MARETGATYIDLWPIFVDRQNRLDASLTGDGLHLNPARLRALGALSPAAPLPRCHRRRQSLATASPYGSTTGDRSALLARQPTLTFGTAANARPTITVDGATTYQSMAGFGYTLTGGSAYVINRMPAAARDALLRELFGRDRSSLG
jgi:glucosylceramidase